MIVVVVVHVVVIGTVNVGLIHHLLIEIIKLVHQIRVTIKLSLFILVQLLKVTFNFQVSIEIDQTLSNNTD
jgi:hypothetical protein